MAKMLLTFGMMICGNVFMTTAWYWHLRRGAADGKPLVLIVLASWSIALLEYAVMVPANRIGAAAGLSVAQLKVAQEVIYPDKTVIQKDTCTAMLTAVLRHGNNLMFIN